MRERAVENVEDRRGVLLVVLGRLGTVWGPYWGHLGLFVCQPFRAQAIAVDKMLCCALLCSAMDCYDLLCSAMFGYARLCSGMLCYAVLGHALLCLAMLCYAMLCYAQL